MKTTSLIQSNKAINAKHMTIPVPIMAKRQSPPLRVNGMDAIIASLQPKFPRGMSHDQD